ncbi:MAG: HepT-like ribonuclease domain-containing protein [bacterium JZ-2024 1]
MSKIHFYFGVNLDIVWKIVEDKLPQLKKQVEDILKGMK